MKRVIKYIAIFLIFDIAYYAIEKIFSGNSNWSSLIMGGIGGLLFSDINKYYTYETSPWKQILLATIIMIFIELFFGLILRAMGFQYWDYSDRFMNVEGLICLRYSLYWLFLSPIAIGLDDLIEYVFFNEYGNKLKFKEEVYLWKRIST